MIKNKQYDFKEGEVLFFDKPLNWTSFDVVKKVRYWAKRYHDLKKLKVGHAGTLDPLASGLIIICTGKKTKQIESYVGLKKEYIADIFIGATTASFDKETEVDKIYETKHIDENLIKNTLETFVGKQKQIPSKFSAKKVNGQRAYIKARKGEELILKPSDIHIYNIELIECELPNMKIKTTCSKGTYIRALARDIGFALESGAYLTGLRRTKIGDYSIENTIDIDNFEENLYSTQ